MIVIVIVVVIVVVVVVVVVIVIVIVVVIVAVVMIRPMIENAVEVVVVGIDVGLLLAARDPSWDLDPAVLQIRLASTTKRPWSFCADRPVDDHAGRSESAGTQARAGRDSPVSSTMRIVAEPAVTAATSSQLGRTGQ